MKLSRPHITFLILLSIAFPLSVSACGTGEKTAAGYENVTIEHAYNHWKQGKDSKIPFIFLDVRTPSEYAEGHIPGAKLIPIRELPDRLNEVPRDKRVYVYCESGGRAIRAARILAGAGFKNIENVPASMAGWRKAGYPIEK
jgi:rhodanese-related sulfurtransferase